MARAVMSIALALTIGVVFSTTAHARDDRDWRAHEVRARHYHVVHPHVVEPVIYSPPMVVEAPPPPPPGINLIVPLNFH
jgi:hypothetical protein